MSEAATASPLLYSEADWDFDTLKRAYDAIEDIALNDLGLDVYPNQIEIIASEQMLDAYSSHGMPLMYKHWSFGKHFARDQMMYQKGYSGLAYEIVINSNPCIAYLMEENTMTMQALVMAHASFGHNHFFKNNYLFRQWTDADGILAYLDFAKKYIAKCEDEYGFEEVEAVLDASHALMDQGVFRYNACRKKTGLRKSPRASATKRLTSTTFGARCPTSKNPTTKRKNARRKSAISSCPKKIFSTLSRRPRPFCARGSASWCASSATSRSIFIRKSRRK